MFKENFLTPAQKKTVAAALTFTSIVAIVLLFAFSILVISIFVNVFDKVLWPLALASILAVLLQPVISLAHKKLKLSPIASISLLYLLIVVVVALVSVFVFPKLIRESIDLVASMPEIARNLWLMFKEQYPEVITLANEKLGAETLAEYTHGGYELLQTAFLSMIPALHTIKGTAANLFSWTAALAVIPIYLFYLLTFKKSPLALLEKEVKSTKLAWAKQALSLFREFSDILVAFFRGQLLIGLIMGILYSVAFSLIGLKFALPLGLAAGFLNIIPYLGTILGLASTLPVAYFQNNGSFNLLLLTAFCFLAVQLIESYFLTPKIMKEKTGLHPMAIIASIFFWGTAFSGVLGIILGVPLTAFIVVLWHWLKRDYISA